MSREAMEGDSFGGRLSTLKTPGRLAWSFPRSPRCGTANSAFDFSGTYEFPVGLIEIPSLPHGFFLDS